MANPVVVADVESRWRPLSVAETTNAESLLADAWQILTARVPSLQSRLTDLSLATGLVVAVEAAMVLRAMRNPEGARTRSTAIDDFTESVTLDSAVSTGALYASDDELALLSPAGDTSSAFSITPFGEPGFDETASPWPVDWDVPA